MRWCGVLRILLWSIECQLEPARLWPLFARGETRREANATVSARGARGSRSRAGWRTLGVVRTEKGGRGVWRVAWISISDKAVWRRQFTFVLHVHVYMLCMHLVIAPCLDKLRIGSPENTVGCRENLPRGGRLCRTRRPTLLCPRGREWSMVYGVWSPEHRNRGDCLRSPRSTQDAPAARFL